MPDVKCSECREPFEVSLDFLGYEVECPHCSQSVTANESIFLELSSGKFPFWDASRHLLNFYHDLIEKSEKLFIDFENEECANNRKVAAYFLRKAAEQANFHFVEYTPDSLTDVSVSEGELQQAILDEETDELLQHFEDIRSDKSTGRLQKLKTDDLTVESLQLFTSADEIDRTADKRVYQDFEDCSDLRLQAHSLRLEAFDLLVKKYRSDLPLLYPAIRPNLTLANKYSLDDQIEVICHKCRSVNIVPGNSAGKYGLCKICNGASVFHLREYYSILESTKGESLVSAKELLVESHRRQNTSDRIFLTRIQTEDLTTDALNLFIHERMKSRYFRRVAHALMGFHLTDMNEESLNKIDQLEAQLDTGWFDFDSAKLKETYEEMRDVRQDSLNMARSDFNEDARDLLQSANRMEHQANEDLYWNGEDNGSRKEAQRLRLIVINQRLQAFSNRSLNRACDPDRSLASNEDWNDSSTKVKTEIASVPKENEYSRFMRLHQQGKASLAVDRTRAYVVCNKDYRLGSSVRFANLFWINAGCLLPVVGLSLLFFRLWGWAIGAVLLGVIIVNSARNSACDFIRKKSLEDEDFFLDMLDKKVVLIRER